MADDNALAPTDLQRAQEIIRGAHTGKPADEAAYIGRQAELQTLLGGTAGGGAESAEVGDLTKRIKAITALAHSRVPKEQDEYERLQPDLYRLIAEREALRRGTKKAAAKEAPASVPKAGASKADVEAFHRDIGLPPESPLDYPGLPDDGRPAELMAENSHLWLRALPKLHRAGITMKQAGALGAILREAETDLAAYHVEYAQQRHQNSERELKRRYGANYSADVDRAKVYVRQLLPNGGSRDLCALLLADGSVLGDHPLFCRLLIEFGRDGLEGRNR